MAAALWHHKVLDFPTPDKYPVWKSIVHGDYGYLGSYGTTTTTTTTTTVVAPPKTHTPPPHDPSPSAGGTKPVAPPARPTASGTPPHVVP